MTTDTPSEEPGDGGGLVAELLPCPHCRGNAFLHDVEGHTYYAQCESCGYKGALCKSVMDGAVKLWNKQLRPDRARWQATTDRLLALCDDLKSLGVVGMAVADSIRIILAETAEEGKQP